MYNEFQNNRRIALRLKGHGVIEVPYGLHTVLVAGSFRPKRAGVTITLLGIDLFSTPILCALLSINLAERSKQRERNNRNQSRAK